MKKKYFFESSSSYFLFNPSLKVFLKGFRVQSEKDRGFYKAFKVETQNGGVLIYRSPK